MTTAKKRLKKMAVLGLSAAFIGASFANWQFTPMNVFAEVQETQEESSIADNQAFVATNVAIKSDLSTTFLVKIPTAASNVSAKVTFLDDVRNVELEKVSTEGENDTYSFVYDGVSAQHMTDDMLVRVDYEMSDKSYYAEQSVSVKDYCEQLASYDRYALNMPQDTYEKLIRLVTDMLDYGAAAQLYTEYQVDNLANENVDKILSDSGVAASEFVAVETTDASVSGDKYDGIVWQNPTVNYGSGVSISFRFKIVEDVPVSSVAIKATVGDDEKTLAISQTDTDGVYEATLNDVGVVDFDTPVTAKIYKDGQAVGRTFTYSVKSYVYNQQSKEGTVAALARATYTYGKSAVAFNGAHVHTFSGEPTIQAATCTTPGSITRNCTDCGEDDVQILVALGHDYDIKEDTIGVQTMHCSTCGDSLLNGTSPALYHNYTAADQIGENTNFRNQEGNLDRKNIESKKYANVSVVVKAACELSYEQDFVSNFYGGAGVGYSFYAEQAGKATVVFKVSSGWLTQTNWHTAAATGDMVFNKVFEVKINGQTVKVGDEVVLKGATGLKYEVCANWIYVPLEMDVDFGENRVELISLQPYDSNGELLYKDAGADGTQSTPLVDTVAVYTSVNVQESKNLTELQIAQNPSKTVYNEGDYIDMSGFVLNGKYSNYPTTEITNYTVSPSVDNPLTTDVDEIVVSVGSKSVSIPITVNALDKKLVLTTAPTKTEYKVGESFVADGMAVSLDVSGNVSSLTAEDYTVSGGENLAFGSVVTVTLNSDSSIKMNLPIKITTDILEFNSTAGLYSNVSTTGSVDVSFRDKDDALANAATNKTFISAKAGATITYSFTSTAAVKTNLILCASTAAVKSYGTANEWWPSETFDMQANKIFKLYVGTSESTLTEITVSDDVVFAGSSDGNGQGDLGLLGNFMEQTLAQVQLAEGVNIIKLVFVNESEWSYYNYKNGEQSGMAGFNMDYLRIVTK